MNDNDAFEPDSTLTSVNAAEKTIKFVNYIHKAIVPGRHGNHVALPWGCDFAYYNANQNFREMEKLVTYINEHNTANIKVLVSTPSQYLDSVKKQNIKWPVYYNDMFPYSDQKDEYWSGYFSSRPSSKV